MILSHGPHVTPVSGSGELRLTIGTLIDLDHAQWKAHQHLAIGADVDRVDTSFREAEALQVHDDVPGEEWNILRKLDFEFRLDRHVVRVERIAVLVDDVDRQLVTADI